MKNVTCIRCDIDEAYGKHSILSGAIRRAVRSIGDGKDRESCERCVPTLAPVYHRLGDQLIQEYLDELARIEADES